MTTHETTSDHRQPEHHGDEHHEKSFTITIKTLAGHTLPVEVIGSELIAAVAIEATIEFRAKHELANDDATYTLSLPRTGPGGKLDPTSTLIAAGIHAGDELLLLSRAPHVDG
jgi:hypothetical protein